MSGSTIGGFIGAAIGSYFGPIGAQIGGMIGSYIGGVIDPTIIKGPSIGDAQEQTSLGGQPIPKVYGHSPPIAPTLIDGDKIARKITVTQDVGKGATQKTKNQKFIATRFFLVAESYDGEANIARIFRNGKLVYSAIAGDNLDADSASFASQLTIYRGGPDQGPDPSLEAIHGVGNTPYYLDRLCFIVRDDDETQTRGMANQYSVEVVSSGVVTTTTVSRYLPPDYSRFINAGFPLANPDTDYDFVGSYGDGGQLYPGGYGPILGASIAETQANVPGTAYPGWGVPDKYLGYMAGGTGGPYENAAVYMEGHGATTDLTNYKEAWLVYNWMTPTVVHDNLHLRAGDSSGDVAPPNTAGNWHGDALGCVYRSYTTRDFSLYPFIYSMEGFTPLAICLHTKQLAPKDTLAPGEFFLPDAPGYVSDANGNVRKFGGTATLVSGSFKTLALESVSGVIYTQRELGPVMPVGDANDTHAYWDAAYAAAVAAGTMPAGMTYSATGTDGPTTYPRATPHAYLLTTSTTNNLTADTVQWKDIAIDIAGRASALLPARMDVAAMTDPVPGFVLGNYTLTGTDYMRSLCTWYFTDLPEYDGKLHSVRRGGATVGDFTDDDLLFIEQDDHDLRSPAIEAYQRVTVMYPDPANNYVTTPQTAPRTSPDVTANNSITMQCPIPFDANTMAQKADIIQKIAFLQVEGSITRSFPAQFSQYVASDAITFNGRRYLLTKTSNDDSMVRFEGTYDRPSAYTSVAVGAVAPAPTPQTSNLKGPSLICPMNLPQLRTQDTPTGIYVLAKGRLAGWPGCVLQISTDDGATFVPTLTMTNAGTFGTLTANATTSGEPISVDVGDGFLESVTADQIAARANGFALLNADDDNAEVGQFQTADETAAGQYDLTNITRHALGTTAQAFASGSRFALLDAALYYLPISPEFAGKTLIMRPVTIGTADANNDTMKFVFRPMFTSAPTIDFYETDIGEVYTTDAGVYYELS